MAERIQDYITGKSLHVRPEEIVRQQFEHILVDELGYPKSHMTIEFQIQRGAQKKAESADIAVFRSAIQDQTNLLMVIEIEPPGHVFDQQVFSYATATTAEFVVWFDGLDRQKSRGVQYRWRDLQNDPTKFVEIPTIPRFGETLEEIGKYKKYQLKPAKGLKSLFQKMHNRLYGEGPIKREDLIAQEVIKILFCKLYDELHTPNETCEFRVTVSELKSQQGLSKAANRIRNLFRAIKNDPGYCQLFTNDEVQYDDYWICYIVSQLQSMALTHEETDTDALGDAYEAFIGPQLKGESGQFFTPRAVVHLAVEMLNPSFVKRERIIDPACGSGGFLIYALRHIRKEAHLRHSDRGETWIAARIKEYAANFISGIDIEDLLFKVAKSYMALAGNGRTGIFKENSLEQHIYWKPEARERVPLTGFDVLITNPPFGTKIKVESQDILNQYDLAHTLVDDKRGVNTLTGGQDPSILFLERCYQLLRDPTDEKNGGRMAIVLPRQILSGHDNTMVQIRKWLLNRVKILAIVDMPAETFQPYTGTITSVLFAEKARVPFEDYEIFMAAAQNVGHDRRGNPLIARHPDGSMVYDADNNEVVLNDIPLILDAYEKWKRGEAFKTKNPSIFSISFSGIIAQNECRIDASYHDDNKNEVVKQIWGLAGADNGTLEVKTINELIREPNDVFYPNRHKRNYTSKDNGAVPFLSSSDILQTRVVEVKWQPLAYKPIPRCIVRKDWILITRSGTTGLVVYVGDYLAGFPVSEGVAVSEHVIRLIPDPTKIDPAYLYSFLANEKFGKILLTKGIYASVVEHITPEHVRDIPVPVPPLHIQKIIGDNIRKAEKARCCAYKTLIRAETSLVQAIENKTFQIEIYINHANQEDK
ncbi:MAG: N-6 DNA methylase [Nitrospirae bacterium]|nr:N-6 DNA methylase [Nitrospirota bacterium]